MFEGPADVGGGERLFVSYAGRDRAWAEWVAWHLRDAGYRVELDAWDWAAGDNVVLRMSDAVERADRVVALYSEAYFERHRFTTDEWTAVMAGPDRAGRLVPLRLEEVTPPAVLRPMVWRDLFGMGEAATRAALLAAVGGRGGPTGRPVFPPRQRAGQRDEGPRLPGLLPQVWNVPARLPAFTGRDAMLLALRQRLRTRQAVVVQALHGWGGVGKTQLAIEFAHRFAADYDAVWWIDSEQADLIGEQLAGLAQAWGLTASGDVAAAVAAVRAELGRRGRWLLVFDNATGPDELHAWLPQGPGQALVTSRNQHWAGTAEPVPVDVFARAESVALIRRLRPDIAEADADRLATDLGDLPLAVAQAGRLLAETGLALDTYRQELAQHAAQVTALGVPTGYPTSLAAAIRLAATRLASEDEAAGQLLRLCAFLAPEPIPTDLFSAAPDDLLPEPLAAVATGRLALATTVSRLGRYGLARIGPDGLLLHRLVQAILRDDLPTGDQVDARRRVHRLLVAARPDDGTDPRWWPRWTVLLPHILACDPAATDDDALIYLAYSAVWHLHARGDARAALPLAEDLHRQLRQRFGPDHPHTLRAAGNVAITHRHLGHYQRARKIDEDTLTRRRRLLGEDHPDTLNSANNLAADLAELGEHEAARQLDEDTLTRRRRVLGEDHPETLSSAGNLAIRLADLGEHEAARRLAEDTLTRRRRVLGEDHPNTLSSANNLANRLADLGEHEAARRLAEDTLTRRRRVLGEDHPNTLSSANNLAIRLADLGEQEAARRLAEDTLTRRRRVLGEDHPNTLSSAGNLAIRLAAQGEHEAARQLDEDTLTRYRRVLGEDHPNTLSSANNLANRLAALGEHEAARQMDQDTLTRRRQILGEDHPDALSSAGNLAIRLAALGEHEAARELREDVAARRQKRAQPGG